MIQRAIRDETIPPISYFRKWAKEALKEKISQAELTIRIVDKEEMTILNSTYRNKNKPTNVLSFPFKQADFINGSSENDFFLGDIVICADVIKEEALLQEKKIEAHWAHMVVHGVLHLLGFDHEKEIDATIMENEEINILKKLKFSNPYDIMEKKNE